MRVRVPALLTLLLTGCAGSPWLPAVDVWGALSHAEHASARLDRRRRSEGWRGRVGVGLRWRETGPVERPPRLPRRPALAPDPTGRAPCRSARLCAWERRAVARATRALIDGGGS